ncbi:uncharacterized protein LOC103693111 isoform X2 [Rattus norvegicus]|uniref:uncharacterized protein LOC103693111 isoform X2 n=1 Tax=Rattus norvegicus TaxID=10116 RepID=UPI001916CD70|nr:uncharacterized protein LOC103693111 isoform X2 [Rattus norvegicus]
MATDVRAEFCLPHPHPEGGGPAVGSLSVLGFSEVKGRGLGSHLLLPAGKRQPLVWCRRSQGTLWSCGYGRRVLGTALRSSGRLSHLSRFHRMLLFPWARVLCLCTLAPVSEDKYYLTELCPGSQPTGMVPPTFRAGLSRIQRLLDSYRQSEVLERMSTSVNLLPYLLMGAECKCLSIRAFSLVVWPSSLLLAREHPSFQIQLVVQTSRISSSVSCPSWPDSLPCDWGHTSPRGTLIFSDGLSHGRGRA